MEIRPRGMGLVPRPVLAHRPVFPTPCSGAVPCSVSSILHKTLATTLSPTHTPLHTYIYIYVCIYIYKGVHPPTPRSIPFRPIPRGGDVADGPFGGYPNHTGWSNSLLTIKSLN
ncbi:hypothetical protein HanPI659440_Chr06g0236681 [Helianthus annuus]|nr:hypothetical protein HanPI659440_Chr06g0236681 [Helianthus annuus]